jgi:hypothetical protein
MEPQAIRPEPPAPPSKTAQLLDVLDAIPADDPRNYLRQSLQLLVPLLEEILTHLASLEARVRALESGNRLSKD